MSDRRPDVPAPTLLPTPEALEGWLRDLAPLGLAADARVEREGIAAWDVTLDGRRRRDLRTTLILDPGLGLICWAHLAPPRRLRAEQPSMCRSRSRRADSCSD